MGLAPYRHSYQRARPAGGAQAANYLPNPACQWTDQGAEPQPTDLAWCIRHTWRVIYYSHRQALGLPLWPGVDDFEVLMTDVLFRLSSAFQPIEPTVSAEVAEPKDDATDGRADRVKQPSCRVYPTPVFDGREWAD